MTQSKISKKQADFTNRAFQTLHLLEDKKRKRFLKFLQSPYFIQSETLFDLCSTFISLIEKGKKLFDREAVWSKITKGEPYNDVLFRKYCSDILKHLQTFMAHESVSDDPVKQAVECVEFVSVNKIETLYKTSVEEMNACLDQVSYKSTVHYLHAYRFERQYYAMMDFAVQVDKRANLNQISQNLDMLYLIEKLKIAGVAISQKRTRNETYQIAMVEEILETIKQFELEKYPGLSVNYYSFMTLYDEENLEHYYQLRRLLQKYTNDIPKNEALDIYDSALHYCTGKVNTGHPQFFQEYFDLFDEGLRRNIFLVNGEMATWRFNNMVAAGLRLNKFDWTEQFIKKYHTFLPKENQQNSLTFNLARVYRFQKKHHDVITLLQNVEYEDIGHNLISKMMLLITYFELQEIETLISFLNSFSIFLKRHRNIPTQRRTGYLNLIKYTRKLIRLDFSNRKAVEKLRSEISSNKAAVINHEWLLEKLA
ncbi:MAG: hypothetical protein JNJ57_20580 [Saprospiraceae bacterium]|nr:hypothetical protein [Saprospiraceae bacterium]